jgi:hypothetical protein
MTAWMPPPTTFDVRTTAPVVSFDSFNSFDPSCPIFAAPPMLTLLQQRLNFYRSDSCVEITSRIGSSEKNPLQ